MDGVDQGHFDQIAIQKPDCWHLGMDLDLDLELSPRQGNSLVADFMDQVLCGVGIDCRVHLLLTDLVDEQGLLQSPDYALAKQARRIDCFVMHRLILDRNLVDGHRQQPEIVLQFMNQGGVEACIVEFHACAAL